MCDFGLISGGIAAGAALFQGLSGYQAGQANAAYAKAEGEGAYRSSIFQAGQLSRQAGADLGRDRASVAASGFTGDSAAEALASKAGAYGLDIDAILYGGKVAKEQARVAAKQARQQGIGALAGGVLSAAGTAMSLYNPWSNPGVKDPNVYGQPGRYGTSTRYTGVGGRLVGGV